MLPTIAKIIVNTILERIGKNLRSCTTKSKLAFVLNPLEPTKLAPFESFWGSVRTFDLLHPVNREYAVRMEDSEERISIFDAAYDAKNRR